MIDFGIDAGVAQKFSGLSVGLVGGECAANSFSDPAGFAAEKKLAETLEKLVVGCKAGYALKRG